MKKTIRMISIFIVVILMLALPCFAGSNYGNLYNGKVNDVSSRFNIYRPKILDGNIGNRPLDTYNTYNFKISFWLFTSSELDVNQFHFRSDYDYSISEFRKVTSVAPADNFFEYVYPYQPDDDSISTFADIFWISGCHVYKVVLDFQNVHYQSIIDTSKDNVNNDFYRPWFKSDMSQQFLGYCVIYPSQNCFFKGFSVDNNVHAYLIPTQILYTFNSDILVPRYENSDNAFSGGDFFYLGFNNSLFNVCYGQRKAYNFGPTVIRYPFQMTVQIGSANSPTTYAYSLYNYYFEFPGDSHYTDFSPYYSYDNFIQFKINYIQLDFVGAGNTNHFISFKNAFSSREFSRVVAIPCDLDNIFPVGSQYEKFYDSVYKTTSASLMLPTYNFENGDINIDYSQYYLQKENWYDFGKDLYNALIFLIFNIPLLNNVTAPLFMLLNNFIGVWSTLVLPLTTLGIVGAFFLFCFIYKTIKKLVGG